jgi:hypothetical protein
VGKPAAPSGQENSSEQDKLLPTVGYYSTKGREWEGGIIQTSITAEDAEIAEIIERPFSAPSAFSAV